MRPSFFFLVFSFCLFGFAAFAQEKKTIEEKIPAEVLYTPKDKIITLVVENDAFGGRGRDENYTSGVRFSYLDINANMPNIAYQLDDFIPTFEINETTNVFYSIGQNLYTPSNIQQAMANPNDRPWAAHLYGAIGLSTVTDNHTDEVELSLGVVGPLALGEQTQKFVHKYITTDSPEPQGWDNQLKNEPAILLGWQREYTDYKNLDFGDFSLNTSPYYGLTLGNVYTFADTGVSFSFKPNSEYWQDNPVRVKPGLPGTGYYDLPADKWSWYLFSGIEGRAVARNIFLDGNTFRSSPDTDKKHFVADANAGIAFTYNNYRISYTMVYRTKEFDGQDSDTVFGALNFGYRF